MLFQVKEKFGTDVKLDQTLRGHNVSASTLAVANLSDNQVVKVDNFGVSKSNLYLLEEFCSFRPERRYIRTKLID